MLTDTKLDRKDKLPVINEVRTWILDAIAHMHTFVQVCEMKNCRKCIFFEMKKKKDLYMWVSNVPNGPSAKFLVENGRTRLPMHILIMPDVFLYSAHHG